MSYFNLHTKRLVCRRLTEADIPKWLLFFKDNNHLPFMGFDSGKSHEELANEWIKTQFDRYENSGLGHLAVCLKETGELVGLAGIIPREIEGNAEYEVAYSFLPKHWGKGFATEIADMLKNYGLKELNLNRMISIINVNHQQSAKVAEKNGMTVLYETVFNGMDVNIYAIDKKSK